MTESVPISLVEGWINDLKAILKKESVEARTDADYFLNQGMGLGLDEIRRRLNAWRCHQKYVQTLNRQGRKFLMVSRVNLSHGNYRNLDWYEGDLFLTLAWRHAQNAERGELMLVMQHVQALSKTYFVYQGGSSFDDLASLARAGGLDAIKNEGNRGEWDEKPWT